MSTARDLIATAFAELNVIPAGEPVPGELAAMALDVVNRLLDEWNAQRDAVYADVFSTFTLTPSLQPHTIGPSGATWTLARPVSIEDVHLSTDAGVTWSRINVRDAGWYQDLSSPTQTGQPTDVFYNPTAANGQLYFWPIPTSALQVKLWTRQILADLTLDTTIAFPAGYRSAITETLKERLTQMPPYASLQSGGIERAAARARSAIFANNGTPMRLMTADSGLPGGRGGWFDIRTRRFYP